MFTLLLSLSTSALATTWTVDPEGGGDARTLTEGFVLLSDGDTLLVGPGTYNEAYLGLSAKDVTIEGAGAGVSVVDGTGLDAWVGISTSSATISGLTFTHFDQPDGSTALSAGTELVVHDCLFEDNAVAIASSGDVLNVEHSIFIGNTYAVYVVDGVYDLLVDDNVFIDNSSSAVLWRALNGVSFASDLTVSNNTIVGADEGVLFDPEPLHEVPTVRIYNNVFADVRLAVSLGVVGTGTIDHNLAPAGAIMHSDETISISDNITGDAIFLSRTDDGDPTNDDLHLLWGSPGIDQGADSDDSTDFDGQSRSFDGDKDGVAVPDIGAYEYDLDSDDDGHLAVEAGGDDCADADSTTADTTFYADADGYGYGDAASTVVTCPVPDGFVSNPSDCDDTNAGSYPAATETCGDGIDQDCDGGDVACPDTGAIDTTTDDTPPPSEPDKGCATVAAPQSGLGLMLIALLVRRQRRAESVS